MTTPTGGPDLAQGWESPFEQLIGAESAIPGADSSIPPIHQAPREFGTPQTDALFWQGQQGYPDTCAIRCQEFILEQFTNQVIPEDNLVSQAMEHGWYTPGGGTQMQDVGNLLELNGVPVTRYNDATIFNLSNELAQGHKVIVGVDSGELWDRNPILDAIADKLGISGADHAVVVSGIDTTDPSHIQVTISDPGTGGAAVSYPLDQFVDAWQDSGFYMVATQDPAPSWVPEMAHFDYEKGHIDQVWGLSYDNFLSLADQPDSWSYYLDQALEAMGITGIEEHVDAAVAFVEDLFGGDGLQSDWLAITGALEDADNWSDSGDEFQRGGDSDTDMTDADANNSV